MRFSSGIFAGVVLGAVIAMTSPAFADDADKLFEQGLAAYKEGKFEDALSRYQAAWKLRKTQDLAAAMAQVELLMSKQRDAAEHLTYALRYFPVSGKKELRDTLEKALAEAKTKVAEVHLQVTGDAQAPVITVDGAALDVEVTGKDFFVAPGKHVVEASAKGYPSVRQTIDVKEGQAAEVTLSLLPAVTPPQRSIVAPAIAFGVGGAGLVVGAIAGAVVISGHDDLAKTCAPSGECPKSASGELDTTRTMTHVSTAGFVVAGVGAAVGVALLLIPGKSAAAPRAAVHMGPGFVGVKGVF